MKEGENVALLQATDWVDDRMDMEKGVREGPPNGKENDDANYWASLQNRQ